MLYKYGIISFAKKLFLYSLFYLCFALSLSITNFKVLQFLPFSITTCLLIIQLLSLNIQGANMSVFSSIYYTCWWHVLKICWGKQITVIILDKKKNDFFFSLIFH